MNIYYILLSKTFVLKNKNNLFINSFLNKFLFKYLIYINNKVEIIYFNEKMNISKFIYLSFINCFCFSILFVFYKIISPNFQEMKEKNLRILK